MTGHDRVVAVDAKIPDAGLDQVVARPTRTASWNLVRDGTTAASAYAVCRPDRRWFVSVDAWDDRDHDPLVHAMIADLGQDLYTRIDSADPATLCRTTIRGSVARPLV